LCVDNYLLKMCVLFMIFNFEGIVNSQPLTIIS